MARCCSSSRWAISRSDWEDDSLLLGSAEDCAGVEMGGRKREGERVWRNMIKWGQGFKDMRRECVCVCVKEGARVSKVEGSELQSKKTVRARA